MIDSRASCSRVEGNAGEKGELQNRSSRDKPLSLLRVQSLRVDCREAGLMMRLALQTPDLLGFFLGQDNASCAQCKWNIKWGWS